MSAERLLELFNYGEGVLWLLLAFVTVFWLVTGRVNRRFRIIGWLLAVMLAVFGASDFFEVRSGAWWGPWWLLAVKGVCIAFFIFAGVTYWRISRRNKLRPK